MKLDREIWMLMLRQLSKSNKPFDSVDQFDLPDLDTATRYLYAEYLRDHGLVELGVFNGLRSGPQITSIKLTSKGRDHISEDGGLTAELGVVTIKLHEDTIKSLIESQILASELPEPQKRTMIHALRELPAESTTHLVKTLVGEGVKLGLRGAPNAYQWLHNLISGF